MDWLLDSIRSCIEQIGPHETEVLVVSDGNTQESLRRLVDEFNDEPRVRLLDTGSNLGVAGALNRGLSEAKGEWIARIDADDWSYCHRIESQLLLSEQMGGLDAIGSAMDVMTGRDAEMQVMHAPVWGDRRGLEKLLERRTVPIWHPTALIRRDRLVEAGGWPEGYPWAEDLALWVRAWNRGWRLGNVSEPLAVRRVHGANVSITHGNKQRDSADKVMREWHDLL